MRVGCNWIMKQSQIQVIKQYGTKWFWIYNAAAILKLFNVEIQPKGGTTLVWLILHRTKKFYWDYQEQGSLECFQCTTRFRDVTFQGTMLSIKWQPVFAKIFLIKSRLQFQETFVILLSATLFLPSLTFTPANDVYDKTKNLGQTQTLLPWDKKKLNESR